MTWWRAAALVVLIVLAGCNGIGQPDTPTQTTTRQISTTPTQQTPPTADISNATAKERAIDAEETRVKTILHENPGYMEIGVPSQDQPTATVVNRTSAGVRVNVTMSYSYFYNCAYERAGTVSNAKTWTTYLVTEDEAKLVDVQMDVTLFCEGFFTTTQTSSSTGYRIPSSE